MYDFVVLHLEGELEIDLFGFEDNGKANDNHW
jgi:hypothetical protein